MRGTIIRGRGRDFEGQGGARWRKPLLRFCLLGSLAGGTEAELGGCR